MLNGLIMAAGFLPLIAGAEMLVNGASSVAKKMGVGDMVIGMTIIAFGTSAPELAVNVLASLKGSSGIVMGNVLGSNIFNILMVIGVSAVMRPVRISRNTTRVDVPLCLLSSLAVFVLSDLFFAPGSGAGTLSCFDGMILLLLFAGFLYYNASLLKKEPASADGPEGRGGMLFPALMILAGLFLLFAGGRVIVEYGMIFARSIGMSEALIGATFVAAGTSLPELAASVSAVRKGKTDLALGNVLGSNIFNVLFILGMSSVIGTVDVDPVFRAEIIINMFASALLFLFIFTGRGRRIDRREGAAFIIIYLAQLIYLFLR